MADSVPTNSERGWSQSLTIIPGWTLALGLLILCAPSTSSLSIPRLQDEDIPAVWDSEMPSEII